MKFNANVQELVSIKLRVGDVKLIFYQFGVRNISNIWAVLYSGSLINQ